MKRREEIELIVVRKIRFYERRNFLDASPLFSPDVPATPTPDWRRLGQRSQRLRVKSGKRTFERPSFSRGKERTSHSPPSMPDGVAAVGERSKRRATRRRVLGGASRDRNDVALYLSNPFRRCHSRSSEDVTSSNEFQGVTNCRQSRVLVSVRFLATPPGESVVRKRGSLCWNRSRRKCNVQNENRRGEEFVYRYQ